MTIQYWNKVHIEKYSKADWVTKPSVFAEQCLQYFPKTGTLLEIGAGQGGDATYFQSLGYEVTATDYSDKALEMARARVKDVHFINVDTINGIPFPDKSFDIIYSHLALHYFDITTTEKVFCDIYKKLKDGGIFATITNSMSDPEKEEHGYIELEQGYYQDPRGVKKRYFSVQDIQHLTKGLFEPILLDANGKTYKDPEPNLIRYIGKKLNESQIV